MEVKILFNSSSLSQKFSVGWGISFLIGDSVLFDTGERGEFLQNNVSNMGVDLSRMGDIVISHDHWDHTGGLWDVLKGKKGINVHACPGFSDDFKEKVNYYNGNLIEHDGCAKITKDIYITGEVLGEYKGNDISEQAVVVDSEAGLTVMTGCAHPGIIKIVDLVHKQFPDKSFYSVFGGFHLMNKHPRNIHSIMETFKGLGVKKVGPTHCSGKEAEDMFKEEFDENFLSMKTGEVVSI